MLLRYHAHDVGIVAELMRVRRIAGCEVVAGAPQSLVDLYLDTESFTLADLGFALRLRQHDGAFYGRLRPLHAALGDREAAQRQTLPGALPLPLTLDALAPGALQAALRTLVGKVSLDLHARVRFERTPRGLRLAGQPAAMLVIDEVRYEWARDFDQAREVKVRVLPNAAHPAALLHELDAMVRAYGLVPMDADRFASVLERLSSAPMAPLLLSHRERTRLSEIANGPQLVPARRARALLRVANRRSTADVAQEVGMESSRVRHWVQRFRAQRLGMFEPGQASGSTDATYVQAEEVLPNGSAAAQVGAAPATEPQRGLDPTRRPPIRIAPGPATDTRRRPGVGTELDAPVGTDRPVRLRPSASGREIETAELPAVAERGGVISRVARVVTRRRGRAAARLSDPAAGGSEAVAADRYRTDEPARIEEVEPDARHRTPEREAQHRRLSACMRSELAAVRHAWEASGLFEDGAFGDLTEATSALNVIDQFLGLLDCYAPFLPDRSDAVQSRAMEVRAQLVRLRAVDIMMRLTEAIAEDEDLTHAASLLRRHARDSWVALRTWWASEPAAPDERGRLGLGEVLDRLPLPSSRQQDDGVLLRHVLASMAWRQYERIVVASESESVHDGPDLTLALHGLMTALQHTFHTHALPESQETRLLHQARAHAAALEAMSEAARVLVSLGYDQAVAQDIEPLRQRLDVARREEKQATEHALSLVLARPFKTYLGVVVAAS
ncbi:MAG: helix-turn-helix domain-containing protein [Bacteroidota bacterium]